MATTRNSPEHSATQGPALENPHMSGLSLVDIRQQAEDCRRCDLYKHATQLVFGAGPENAKLMLVGEQPGDKEDLAGKPFVGPAGTVLTECLEEAGIERQTCYLTNAVKHLSMSSVASADCIRSPTPAKFSVAPGGSAPNSPACDQP